MKQLRSFLAALFILVSPCLHADEGMWLLNLVSELNINKMHSLGCKLSAEDIYSVNKSSLKDAVVLFGEGCTAEIVSNQGLILTNHHCGYDAIQYFSTVEHDYLSNGFWAKSKSEELCMPDLSVTFLIRIEDVSKKILPKLTSKMTEAERDTAIAAVTRKLVIDAIAGTHYQADVQEYYGGNAFYLLVYEKYTDVRLVGAPPSSIGKFGGDTDNWMWPRHTGDFSVFRVYSGPDGKPAPYSKDNIPLKPKKYLPVSLKGVEKDDYTMVIGYPGSTQRYMTSYGVKELLELENPARIKVRTARLNILMADMNADPAIRIKYSDKYSRSSNYWKNSIGQDKGIVNLQVIEKKQVQEALFQNWVNADADRKQKYGNVLNTIDKTILNRKDYEQAMMYLSEALLEGSEILSLPLPFLELYGFLKLKSNDPEKLKELTNSLREKSRKFYKDYNAPTDKKVSEVMFRLFYENVKPELHPSFLTDIQKKYKGDYKKYVDNLFEKSMFADEKKLMAFLDNPKVKTIEKDPVFIASVAVAQAYWQMQDLYTSFENQLKICDRLYIAGLQEMNKDKIFYPDANSTMRLTYGKVGDYKARDAVFYDYKTTLKGVMEKEDSTNNEFIVPAKLKQLYQAKDYGIYGKNGEMPVCFTTNNDITGGNSGSPVLNANGELIGLAFDGNWEAMSGDIIYEPDVQKTICVDIRYVLFVMDKFAGAKYLVDEMTLN
ncbi:MAG: S46 family peptidase [Bacteroidota bacterium]|nr:S46 family peptidase [Bacteroidota bacterium]